MPTIFIVSIFASLVSLCASFSSFGHTSNVAHHPDLLEFRSNVIFARTFRCRRSSCSLLVAAAKEGKAAKSGGGFASGGFGKKSNGKTAPAVDAATLLRQSMDLYDRLCQSAGSVATSESEGEDAAEMPELREYVVCVRHSGETQVHRLPCAQSRLTFLKRHGSTRPSAAERLGSRELRRPEVARGADRQQSAAARRRRSPPGHARRRPRAAPRDLGVRLPGFTPTSSPNRPSRIQGE